MCQVSLWACLLHPKSLWLCEIWSLKVDQKKNQPVVVAVDSDVVVCVVPSLIPEAAGKENPGAVVVPVVPRVRPVEVVLVVAVAAAVVANPDNEPITGVAELVAAAGTPSVNPVLAGVAAVPPNLSPPPRDSPLVVVVAGVAPRVNPELGLPPALPLPSANPVEAEEAAAVAPPGVNAGIGFTVAGVVVLPTPSVKPCDGADPKLNPPA